jgi:phosphatidylglycerophosphatase B
MLNLYESNINLFLQKNFQYSIGFFKYITHLVIFTYPLLLISLYMKKIKLKHIIFFKLGMLLVLFIKRIVGRPRPYMVNNNIIKYDTTVRNFTSFPSGHAFSAIYIMLLFNKNKYIKVICSMIIFSRLILGVHYMTDIIASYIISYIIIKSFFDYT